MKTIARTKKRQIIRGDRVQWKLRYAPSKKSAKRTGTVGYCPYLVGLCCVTWDGRKTHDILYKKQLRRAS